MKREVSFLVSLMNLVILSVDIDVGLCLINYPPVVITVNIIQSVANSNASMITP